MAKIEKTQILDIIKNKKQQIEMALIKKFDENPDVGYMFDENPNIVFVIVKEAEIKICNELEDEINKLETHEIAHDSKLNNEMVRPRIDSFYSNEQM